MNKKNLVKIINKELTILSDFVEGFNEDEKINPIEVDLALSKVKDIYDELLLLKEGENKAQDSIPSIKKNRTIEVENIPVVLKTPEIEKVEEIIKEVPEPIKEVEIKEEVETIDTIVEEPINDLEVTAVPTIENEGVEKKEEEITEVEIEPEVVLETIVEPKIVEAIIEKPDATKLNFKGENEIIKSEEIKLEEKLKGEIIADKFSKDSLSVNDMLAGVKKNKDLASLLKDSPIADLKKAIKLNDRIWYINELFNKNGSTFENAVEIVNKSANLDLALEYLFTNFTWDQNRKSTISFLELVFRRFASN